MLGDETHTPSARVGAPAPVEASGRTPSAHRPLLAPSALALLCVLGVAALLGMPRSRAADDAASASTARASTAPATLDEPSVPSAADPLADASAPALAAAPLAAAPSPGALDAPALDRTPATSAGARVLSRLEAIRASARVTRYVHFTQVDEALGSFLWDCSGMVGWVLRAESRRHFAALGSRRPFARDFARLVRRSSTLYPRRGWRRVLLLRDARAGDVFAWEHAQGDLVTGHVGFVLAAPTPVREHDRVFAVRVADSTKQPHDDDSRAASSDSDGGLGEGTMYFSVDDTGRGIAYAWDAAHLEAPVRTRIWVGRLE